jgi:F0F1-type ATP synthase assembly protein I
MNQDPSRWYRYAGMGVEFAASFGAFVAVGWWVGRHWECNPWAMLVGAALGFIGAMYNLIREGLKMTREAGSQDAGNPAHDRTGRDRE